MEELYQHGIELWEKAEQAMKMDKISPSEARRQMIFYQKQAVECWQQAAEGGVASAAAILGDRYSQGKSRNYKKAIYWEEY